MDIKIFRASRLGSVFLVDANLIVMRIKLSESRRLSRYDTKLRPVRPILRTQNHLVDRQRDD